MSHSGNTSEWPLEPAGESFRQLLSQAAERLARFLDELPDAPAANFDDAERWARAVRQPMPESGRPFDQILEQLFERVFSRGFNTTGPGYLAYIPGGGLPDAAVADLLALVVNRYPGLWTAAPVVAAIEAVVIRWFCDLMGYGPASGGFLTSGGSLANWSALILARDTRLPNDFRRGVVYTSTQAHHSVEKAVLLAGLDRRHFRRIPVDEQQRVRCEALAESIARDRAEGLHPLAIVAHAGSTNTGAVDDLAAVAAVAEREQLWLHVDAAYGGFFRFTDRGRATLAGIERADSVTLDPHKGLFLPYGTGCLLVRERAHLRQVFALRGEYMTVQATDPEFVDFCDESPELTRDFRALRIWLPLQLRGAAPFRASLDEKLDLARFAAEALRQIEGLEVVAESPLSIVAFRLHRPEWSLAEANEQNRAFLSRINASRRVLLSSTLLDGQLVLRLCILSFRTHRERIEECLQLIRRAAVC